MDYGNVFSRAWRICWNHKYLFVLGFLAALGSGSGSGGGQGFNYSFSGDELPPGALENMERLFALAGPALALLACVAVIVGIVLWLVRMVAQAGLISSAARLDRGEATSLGQAFSAGTSYLPRFVGLNILTYLPFWIISLVFIAVGVFGFGAAIASAFAGPGEELGALPAGFALLGICAVALFCLLIPVYLLATLIYAFAQRGIVLQGMGVTESMRHGWRFIREHAGEIILLIVLLIVLSLVFGFVTSAVLVPLSLLTFGPVFLDLLRGLPLQTIDIVFAVGGLILLALVGALLNSLMITFRSVSVTLAYDDLLGKGADKVVAP